MADAPQPNESLRELWEHEADAWIAWARSPLHDHAFWRMNLPVMLSLVPPPGQLTIDVACGEGRLARELKRRGHSVIGVEGSVTLARAATELDPDFEVLVADAATMPLPDRAADLVVCSLALMNVDDLQGVVAQIRRILMPGGRLCVSLLHPINSWQDADASYFSETRYREVLEHDGRRLVVNDTHRPLSAYFAALSTEGFVIDRLVEPVPDGRYLAAHPEVERWTRKPSFLHLRAS